MDDLYLELFTKTVDKKAAYNRGLEGIKLQRVRTTHAGDVLMIEAYPVYYSDGMRQAVELAKKRRLKISETAPAQRWGNVARSRRHMQALACENFGPGDIILTLTWRADDPDRPLEAEDARKDVQGKWLRCVNRRRKKMGLGKADWMMTVETAQGPKHGKQHHAHMLMRGDGPSETELRELWRKYHKDARVQTDVVWDRPEALTKWAAYVTKSMQKGADGRQTIQTKKMYYCSQGLKKPRETVAEKKLTPARADKIARDFEGEGRKILEKLHKGYQVIDLDVRTSEWMPGVYVYAVMGKLGAPDVRRRVRWDE